MAKGTWTAERELAHKGSMIPTSCTCPRCSAELHPKRSLIERGMKRLSTYVGRKFKCERCNLTITVRDYRSWPVLSNDTVRELIE